MRLPGAKESELANHTGSSGGTALDTKPPWCSCSALLGGNLIEARNHPFDPSCCLTFSAYLRFCVRTSHSLCLRCEKIPCLARSRAAAKTFSAEPCGPGNTHDTVLHAHQAVVSTPNERAYARETHSVISNVRKIDLKDMPQPI